VNENKDKSGPKPERVKIDMNWEDAVGEAMKKPRPKDGWPDPEKDKKKKK